MSDRFDLEQHILQAWDIIGELKCLRETMPQLSDEDKQAYIRGLELIYETRFQKVWDTFEVCIKAGYFNTKPVECNTTPNQEEKLL
jgi:hypothetical protein